MISERQVWIKVAEMDKKDNGSSVIYGKKTFNFAICYLVILYNDMDLVLK